MNTLNKQSNHPGDSGNFYGLRKRESASAKRAPATDAGGHNKRGIELAEQKQFDAAIAEFTKAIQASPKDPHGYNNRGTAYRASNKFAEAASDFSKAIEVAPKDYIGYMERGETEVMQTNLMLRWPISIKAVN